MKKTKNWKSGDLSHNQKLALRGNKFEDDVWDFFLAWQHLFWMRPHKGQYHSANMKYDGFTKAAVDKRLDELTKETASLVAGAIQSRDVSFLRELADLVEKQDEQHDRIRDWLLAVHFRFDKPPRQVHFYTTAELVKLAVTRSIVKQIDARRMNELCDELGIKRKPDKRGRHKAKTVKKSKVKKSTGDLRK